MLFHLYIELCQHKHLIKSMKSDKPKDWRDLHRDLVCAVIKPHDPSIVSQTLAFGTELSQVWHFRKRV